MNTANLLESIELLKPFSSEVPREALDWIRANWAAAEPVFLAELDAKLARPREEDDSALFLYALYLCAEMRAEKAFEHYLALCRLPNLVLDSVLGDILTEGIPEMLARTCAGRVDDLKALAEDQAANEFARGGALSAMQHLMLDGALSRVDLMAYCIQLLEQDLAWPSLHPWDAVIGVATDIHPEEAMSLIEEAFAKGMADPQIADIEFVREHLRRSRDEVLDATRRNRRELTSTEEGMRFFVSQWSEDGQPHEPEDDAPPLEVLKSHRRQFALRQDVPKAGRNDPCPCGSGKKFKKCCLNDPAAGSQEPTSVVGRPIHPEHARANDWMEAGYIFSELGRQHETERCWRHCWEALQAVLPAALTTPSAAEETGVFLGCDFLTNWLHDFQDHLESSATGSLSTAEFGLTFCDEVLDRFPGMDDPMRQNCEAVRARLLGLSGRGKEALSAAEGMIQAWSDKAQGYVVLSEMLTFEAAQMNVEPDPDQAAGVLRAALEHAGDCSDFDIQARLDDLKRAQDRLP